MLAASEVWRRTQPRVDEGHLATPAQCHNLSEALGAPRAVHASKRKLECVERGWWLHAWRARTLRRAEGVCLQQPIDVLVQPVRVDTCVQACLAHEPPVQPADVLDAVLLLAHHERSSDVERQATAGRCKEPDRRLWAYVLGK